MIDVTQLSRAALENIVRLLVDRLYLDLNPPDCPAELEDCEVYNPEKPWHVDDLEFIADLLTSAELTPEFLGDAPSPPEDAA
jgi:hypothetical protein